MSTENSSYWIKGDHAGSEASPGVRTRLFIATGDIHRPYLRAAPALQRRG